MASVTHATGRDDFGAGDDLVERFDAAAFFGPEL
jgi:hypothetical protein